MFTRSLLNDMVRDHIYVAAKNKRVRDEWIMNYMQGSDVF